jgi:phenylacetate-CoA ligase
VATIRQVCNLRGGVNFVPVGSLANDGKVIDDLRPVEA